MHFSIPDTQDLKDINGSTYKAYNIHVNGVLHCVVRYSQVHELNEQLKQRFGYLNVPNFPPKRLFQVKGFDLDERRLRLERYIQEIAQNSTLVTSDIFVTFLCKAQQETQLEDSIPISFDIHLMNGSKVSLDIYSTDKTNDVLENFVQKLGFNPDLTYYFGLFLVKADPTHQFSLVRKLQEFECPYISLKCLQKRLLYKIVVRTVYWDQMIDEEMCLDSIGFKVLLVQAESDLKMGWTTCPAGTKAHLKNLKSKGSNGDFLKLCQTLPNYGCLQFNPCITNYPHKGSTSVITAGNFQITIASSAGDKDASEQSFLVTRMKCWKMGAAQSNHNPIESLFTMSDQPLLELSFEYLFENGTLKWITILSDQAIMLSMCIKSMVDELMRKRRGEKIKCPSTDRNSAVKLAFKARDKSTEYLFQDQQSCGADGTETVSTIQKAKVSMKKLTEKLSLVSLLSKPTASEGLSPTNIPSSAVNILPPDICRTTFEGIGDEDL